MAKIFINVPPNDEGLPIESAVASRGTGKEILRRSSTWVVAADPANLGHGAPSFGTVGAVQESEALVPGHPRVFRNTLRMPHIGGNKYTVTVTKENRFSKGGKTADTVSADGQTEQQKLEIEAHRKLFFSIQYMKSVKAAYEELKGNIKGLFANSFIDLEGPITPAGVNPELDDLDSIETTGAHALGAEKEAPPVPDSPQHGLWLRFVLVKKIIGDCKLGQRSLSGLAEGDPRVLAPENGQWGIVYELPPAPTDPNPPRYGRSPLGKDPSVGFTFDGEYNPVYAGKSKLKIDILDEGRKLHIRVTDAALNQRLTEAFQGPAKKKIRAEFYDNAGKNFAGMSNGANIAIAIDTIKKKYREYWEATDPHWEAKVPRAVMKVIAHEVCHSIGGPQATVEGVAHPKFYAQDKGGLASPPLGHCGYRTVLRKNADLNDPHKEPKEHVRKLYEAAGGKTDIHVPANDTDPCCIMFHALFAPTIHDADFCPDCIRQMRLLNLSASELDNWTSVV